MGSIEAMNAFCMLLRRIPSLPLRCPSRERRLAGFGSNQGADAGGYGGRPRRLHGAGGDVTGLQEALKGMGKSHGAGRTGWR